MTLSAHLILCFLETGILARHGIISAPWRLKQENPKCGSGLQTEGREGTKGEERESIILWDFSEDSDMRKEGQ